jgi:hypothetical protein
MIVQLSRPRGGYRYGQPSFLLCSSRYRHVLASCDDEFSVVHQWDNVAIIDAEARLTDPRPELVREIRMPGWLKKRNPV